MQDGKSTSLILNLAAFGSPDPASNRYLEIVNDPANCPKCNGLVPSAYVTDGRCPACLAAEVQANAEAVTTEFNRLREIEAVMQEIALNSETDPFRLTRPQLESFYRNVRWLVEETVAVGDGSKASRSWLL